MNSSKFSYLLYTTLPLWTVSKARFHKARCFVPQMVNSSFSQSLN
jgi:hypothetical protein